MKQKKVLVKKVDTRLISELGRGMNVLARKKGESIYNTATIVASYQKTNLLGKFKTSSFCEALF